jgi:dolichyl-phosphate-mannose-protein mannosyltransferase
VTGQLGPLLLILVLAAGLRLWGLGSHPVLFFDSGVYLGEGTFLASAAERAVGGLVGRGPGGPLERVVQATQQGTLGHPPDIGKPGHAILLALGLLLLGGNPLLAGGLVSGLAGIGTVAATYALGLVGWGRRVAIMAALLLAVSGQHLVYSREPLVEADGLLFAALASLIYLRSTTLRGRLLAGVLFGVSFTCNNRLSYVPLVLALVELSPRSLQSAWRARRGAQEGAQEGARSPRGAFLRLVRWAVPLSVGFVLPPALIELAYLAARGLARAGGVIPTWLDYAQQLVAFSRMNPPDRIRFDEWPTYFVDVALMDGPLVLGLLIVGTLVVLARGRSRADRLLLGSLLVPLAIYSIYSTGEVRMRHFSLLLPWMALAAAIGIASLARLVPKRQSGLVAALLTGLAVVLALPRAVSLATPPSGLATIVEALAGRPAASTDGPVLSVFVGEDHTNARLRPAFVDTPSDLSALAADYRLLVVDMQAYLFPGELTARYDRARPFLSVPNGNATWFLADLLEHRGLTWGGWSDLLADWAAHSPAATRIQLYTLTDVLAA